MSVNVALTLRGRGLSVPPPGLPTWISTVAVSSRTFAELFTEPMFAAALTPLGAMTTSLTTFKSPKQRAGATYI